MNVSFNVKGMAGSESGLSLNWNDDSGNSIQLQGSGAPPYFEMDFVGETFKRAMFYKRNDTAITLDYRLRTERKIPVLYAYPEGGADLPVVIFNHGLYGSAQLSMGFVTSLVEAGFFTVVMDAPMHGMRTPENFNRMLYPETFLETFLSILLEGAEDTSAIIDSLEANPLSDHTRIGLTGNSMGGFMTFMTLTRESRVKAAATVIGSPDLETRFGPGQEFDDHPEALKQRVRNHNPLRNFVRMPVIPLLMQNGDADISVPVDGVRKLYGKLKDRYSENPGSLELIEYPGMGHTDTFKNDRFLIRDRVCSWFREYL